MSGLGLSFGEFAGVLHACRPLWVAACRAEEFLAQLARADPEAAARVLRLTARQARAVRGLVEAVQEAEWSAGNN